MTHRVVIWGTGNVGRPAIRAVASHRDLELVGVVVSNPDKVGRDAGELAGIEPLRIVATDDTAVALDPAVDAVIYTASGDFRPDDAQRDLEACLAAGVNVVSTSFYGLLHPGSVPDDLHSSITEACERGDSSVFVSGIDPGWAIDILPLVVSGVCADIAQIRIQELFNYALYDQPEAVRTIIGFGQPMDQLPLMLHDFALEMVWAPMIRTLADGLDLAIDEITTHVERRPLERTIEVPGMGIFDEGTLGAFRFEVCGVVDGHPLLVVEHITRIDDDCAPDWPIAPSGQGVHRVVITGHPDLTIDVHGVEQGEPGAAGGGNATAANRIVNAVPAVCAAPAGIVGSLDLPTITGARQLRQI